MIVKFDAHTPQNMVWEIDTDNNPIVIVHSGYRMTLSELSKMVETAQAALEFAQTSQFGHDYDEAHKEPGK